MSTRKPQEKIRERNSFIFDLQKNERVRLQKETELYAQLQEKATRIWYQQAEQAVQCDLFNSKNP